MNNFGQIAYNVGIRVSDTSMPFSKIINGYINQRYERIFKKFNWPTINPTYNFNTVIGTNTYTLPSNIGKELYVFDNTNGVNLTKNSLAELESIYTQSLNDNDSPRAYAIYDSLDTNTPANIVKTIQLYPNPTSIIQINMPYQIAYSAMTDASDLPSIKCDIACELGATADAWRTKRQFQKAADFEKQYEQVIMEMIWEIENDPNRVTQFRPNVYPIHQLY